jgi:hypothetical protein
MPRQTLIAVESHSPQRAVRALDIARPANPTFPWCVTRSVESGFTCCNFRIAVRRDWQKASGDVCGQNKTPAAGPGRKTACCIYTSCIRRWVSTTEAHLQGLSTLRIFLTFAALVALMLRAMLFGPLEPMNGQQCWHRTSIRNMPQNKTPAAGGRGAKTHAAFIHRVSRPRSQIDFSCLQVLSTLPRTRSYRDRERTTGIARQRSLRAVSRKPQPRRWAIAAHINSQEM